MANIVVEATGAAITSAAAEAAGGVTAGVVDASGPLGYLAEGARTNLCLQSQTLGTTWVASGADTTLAADAAVAPDGTTTADKIKEATTNSAVHNYAQVMGVIGAAAHTFSVYVKPAERSWVLLEIVGTGNDFYQSFNVTTGAKGTLTDGASTSTITPAGGGWYKITLTGTTSANSQQIKLWISNSDSAAAYAGTVDSGAYFWGAQLEAASFASTYIPTTTVAVARNASVDQYVSAGNISATATSLTMQITPTVSLTAATEYFHWASYVDANNYTALLSDGTNLIARKRIGGANHDATIAWNRASGTTAKVGARFDTTNGVDVFLNGTKGTADTTTTASQMGAAHQVGADGNGANQDFCEHRYFTAYVKSLSDSRMTALTT